MTREADGGAGGTDGGETEVYGVTENFTLKWSSQRIYMMDYERTMNQLFSGSRELFSGKRILLGISDGDGLYAKKSESGRYTAFVTNRELWAYDREEGDSICIFAFGGWNTDDLRALQDRPWGGDPGGVRWGGCGFPGLRLYEPGRQRGIHRRFLLPL